MHTDSSSYVSYFAPIHHHLPPSEHQTSLQRSVGSARMTGSPYPTTTQLHSNPVSGLNHEQFSPPVQPISSYRTPSHYSPLRQTSLGYSPYSSEIAAASAESPLSSSSANESPLPEPPIDNMDNDIAAHVATGNDDHYPYAVSDDIAVGYSYGHIGARPFPLPSYVLEHPELYKQPVSAPLPLNISAAMGYSWSPEAKKFQPLYPPIQQTQRQEHSPKYTSQQPVVPSIHFSTRSSSASAQSFGNDIAEADLVYPQPLPHSRHYTNAPTQMAQHQLPSGYPNLRQSTSAKHKNGLPFPDVYNQSADIASSTNGLGTFDALLESASPPTTSSSTLDLALYAQSPTNPASMNVPVLSAPVPRRSAYYGTSLVDNCERTCQEQEQQQERQGLRVRTQGLQEQLTVRPAEVSPSMGFAELPEGGDEDADGEPDVEPFSLHNGHSISGNSTNRARHTREEGMYNYAGIGGSLSGTVSGEDVDGLDERNGHDLDYRPDEDDDDGDGDFEPRSRTTSKNTRSLRPRSIAGRNPVRYHPYGADVPPSAVKHSPRSPLISADDMSPTSSSGQAGKTRKNSRTLPIPVPVPNLTKKSRGRRVPTVTGTSVVRGQRDAALGARIYLCDVIGCGKCFARGEHLKRHIRSIHTYEKPHKCPYPGCGKEFSRHDNLGQHMKVHKDFPKVMERMRGGGEV